jgi:hypothetical protein
MIEVMTLRKALESALIKKNEIETAQQILSRLKTAEGVYNISNIVQALTINLHLEPCMSSVAMANMLLQHIPADTLDKPISLSDAEVVSRVAAATNKLRHVLEVARQ